MQNSLKLLFTFFLFFSFEAFANEPKMKATFAFVGMNMDYREYDDSSLILDSEKSSFMDVMGFELGYDFYFLRDENSYSEIDVSSMFVAGESEYIGSLLRSENHYGSYRGSTDNQIGDLGVSYRYNYILNDRVTLNGGFGIGFRYWLRSLSSSQEELYSWFSLRPSLGADIKLFAALSIAPRIEYQYGILPKMYENNLDYTFTLASADIIEFSLPLNYEVNNNIDIFIEYVYQQQSIQKSDEMTQYYAGEEYKIYEPDSNADNQYLKFGMAFKY